LPPDQAHAKANQTGDAWIAWMNEVYPDQLHKPKVIKWDAWLNHPLFPEKKAFIDTLYKQDQLFKKMVEESIHRYLTRLSQHTQFDFDQAESLSILFVKEEVAVLALQAELGYDFEIFVEKRNPALQYFFEQVIWCNSPLNLQPVLIKIAL
jgi:hypothetical protein